MKLISVPRINALGLKGPEESPRYLGFDYHKIIETKNEDISEDQILIEREARKLIKKYNCFFIGGDHSITYSLFKSFKEIYGEDSFLIVFDAHADSMLSMSEPTHEEFVYGLVKEGFNPRNILILGLRKIEPEEKEFLDKKKIKYFDAKENLDVIKKHIQETTKSKKVYLSIDVDALDPQICPAVNYPESEGYSKKEFFELVNFIKEKSNIKAADFVEVVPEKDVEEKTREFAIGTIKYLTIN